MSNKNYFIYVEAQYGIVSQAKGEKLHPQTKLIVKHNLADFPDTPDMPQKARQEIFFAQVETSIRLAAASAFIERLKTERRLKLEMGKIKWSVDILQKVSFFPIFTRQEDVGHIERFIDCTDIYGIAERIEERNFALIDMLYRTLGNTKSFPEFEKAQFELGVVSEEVH